MYAQYACREVRLLPVHLYCSHRCLELNSFRFCYIPFGMACHTKLLYHIHAPTHVTSLHALYLPFCAELYRIASHRIVSCSHHADLVAQCPTLESMDAIALHCTACVGGYVALQKCNFGRILAIAIVIVIVLGDTRRRHPTKRRLRR